MKCCFVYIICFLAFSPFKILAQNNNYEGKRKEIDVREIILTEVSDSYEWYITTWKSKSISIPLPVILHSNNSGWHVFMSSKFEEQPVYKGFYIAKENTRIKLWNSMKMVKK